MSSTEYHSDVRLRRKYVPLVTQQYRLRHLSSISARNLTLQPKNHGVYFTLHERPDSPAFYTSEVIENTVDPNWARFNEASKFGTVRKSNPFVLIRIWMLVKPDQPTCIVEWAVYFSGLCFLGEHVPKEGKIFAPNSILFGLMEGFYGDKNCLKGFTAPRVVNFLTAHPNSSRMSYAAYTLERFKTMELAVQQTEAKAAELRSQIATHLQKQEMSQEVAHLKLMRLRVASLQNALWSQLQNIQDLEGRNNTLQKDLERQRLDLQMQQTMFSREQQELREVKAQYYESREQLLKVGMQLMFRRKQLITELATTIYPIEETPDKKGYSICKVQLPHSEEFSGHSDTKISIALGYVCHLLLMLSFFLNVPLRYSINHFGSRSTIYDHINTEISDKHRELPLYTKGKDRVHFEYAVYLLNKNIAQLRQYCGLSTPDLRMTLPNLQQLINLKFNLKTDQTLTSPGILSAAGNNPQPPSSNLLMLASASQGSLPTQDNSSSIPRNDSFPTALDPQARLIASLQQQDAVFNSPLDSMALSSTNPPPPALSSSLDLKHPPSMETRLLSRSPAYSSVPNLASTSHPLEKEGATDQTLDNGMLPSEIPLEHGMSWTPKNPLETSTSYDTINLVSSTASSSNDVIIVNGSSLPSTATSSSVTLIPNHHQEKA